MHQVIDHWRNAVSGFKASEKDSKSEQLRM